MSLGHAFGPGVYLRREGRLVRLDERYRQCVVLLGTAPVGSDDEIEPWGTGFLVADNYVKSSYLVTAAHVVSDMLDAPFDVRFNKRGGEAKVLHIEEPKWVLHPTDKTVDVAVHAIEVPDWADCSQIARSPNLVEGDRFASKDIGAGNRTYTVGLFKFLHGDRRNQPFVFSGHIGLVPDDQKVPVDGWLPEHDDRILVEAYLVEGEPLDGASGSPVFVRRTLGPFALSESGKLQGFMEGSIWLLGLLTDVFTAKPGQDYDIRHGGLIPRGVNVVAPAKRIIEILDHPELAEQRKAAKRREDRSKLPMKARVASKSEPATTRDNPSHKEDFNRLLDAAAQKPKPDDQT